MARYGELILNGHGGWNVKDTPAYAEVPRGTTIHFLTENFKLMMLQDIDSDEVAGRILQQFRDADPNQTGTEYKTVPNYELSPDGVTGAPDWVYTVSQATPLCTNDGSDPAVVCGSGIHRCDGIFADPDVVGAVLYWGACRYVNLNEVDDADYYALTGLNSRQPEVGYQGAEGVEYALADSQVDLYVDELGGLSGSDLNARLEQMRNDFDKETFEMVVDRLNDRDSSLGQEVQDWYDQWKADNPALA